MSRTIVCIVCGVTVTPTSARQKRCSVCGPIVKKQQSKASYERLKHTEEYKEKERLRGERRRQTPEIQAYQYEYARSVRNKEYQKQHYQKRKLKQEYRDSRRNEERRRRARKRELVWEKYADAEIFERDSGRCHMCGKKHQYQKRTWHIDHLIPIFEGGADVKSNVAIACAGCNLKKNKTKLPQGEQLLLVG